MITCNICEEQLENKIKFGYHLQFKHKVKIEDYIIRFKYQGIRPVCLECGKFTRYCRTSSDFKKYCIEHYKLACALSGKIGGLAPAWNKGQTKETNETLKKQSEKQIGEGNHFYNKKHTEETKLKIKLKKMISKENFEQRILSRSKEFKCLTNYEDYFSRQHQYLLLECVSCNHSQQKTLQAFERDSLCEKCFPNTISRAQIEIYEYVKSLENSAIQCNRFVISPLELDIFVEKENFAIEYNGLYWHSEFIDRCKDRHYEKTISCKNKNIRLLHIFGDDWEFKKDIIKSMISNALGRSERIFARKCDFKIIDYKEAKPFLEKSHISGSVPGCWYGGLYHNNDLVLCLSLRKPRQKKYDDKIEIARFATKPFCRVIGGFSKVFNNALIWAKNNNYKSIISYCDLTYSNGNVYEKSGFTNMGHTGLNYWYTDGIQRFDRFKFRAQNDKSEEEIAKENKVARIYGCGNNLYEKIIL